MLTGDSPMFAQLNRLMALGTLCGLLTRMAMAGPNELQIAVADNDTSVVPLLAEPLLADGPSLAASDDSLSTQTEYKEEMGAGRRIAGKLISGVFWSIPIGAATTGIGLSLHDEDEDPSNRNDIAALGGILYFSFGYALGAAVGVTRSDPYDRFLPTLVGSLGGTAATLIALPFAPFPPMILAPIIIATIVSERSRRPPKAGISIGLVPDPRGHLSAIATLRF